MKHNHEISDEVRRENDEYNADWISTEGLIGDIVVAQELLDVDEAAKLDACPFMVVWLKNIDRLCNLLPEGFDYKTYTLVDVGCGSGISTIYFLKNYGFKRVIGFDFSSSLIEVAEKNRKYLCSQDIDIEGFLFEIGDAKTYQLPNEPLALFMFNPFGWKTMDGFIKSNIDVLRSNKSVMLYANDIYVNQIEKFGKVLSRDSFFNLSVIGFGY